MPNIPSTDARKPAIMAAFKKHFQCTKVTNVAEKGDSFVAHCLVRRATSSGFRSLGQKLLTKTEVFQKTGPDIKMMTLELWPSEYENLRELLKHQSQNSCEYALTQQTENLSDKAYDLFLTSYSICKKMVARV